MSNVGLQTIPEWRYITPNTKIFIQNASVEIGGAYSPGAGPDFIRMNQRGSARKSSIDLDTVPATADPGKPFDIEKAIDKDPDSLRLLCWPQQAHQEEYSAMRESHTPPLSHRTSVESLISTLAIKPTKKLLLIRVLDESASVS